MSAISFFVPCVPPKTTAQQKGAFSAGGRIRFFTKKKVAQAESDYISLLMRHAPADPMEGPLRLRVCLTWPWRKSEKKGVVARGWAPMTSKPDFDNASKMLCDVMTKLRFWTDDSQIADGRVAKGWGDRPGVYVEVAPFAEEGWMRRDSPAGN